MQNIVIVLGGSLHCTYPIVVTVTVYKLLLLKGGNCSWEINYAITE